MTVTKYFKVTTHLVYLKIYLQILGYEDGIMNKKLNKSHEKVNNDAARICATFN